MKRMEAEQVVTILTDFVNNFNSDEEGFIQAMSREHRTLQQSFTRLVLKWIEFCANEKYHFDRRNEATHTVSKDMVEAFSKFKEEQLPAHWKDVKPSEFIPYI